MGSMPQLSIVKGKQQEFAPQPLHRIFEQQLQQQPTKTALIYNASLTYATDQTRQTTYQQLNRQANQCARLLVAQAITHDLQPNADGDYIVAVCMQPSDVLITSLISVWKAGAAYLPIDPSFPDSRIQHILQESRPLLVLHDDDIDASKFAGSMTISASTLQRKSHDLTGTNLLSGEMLANGSKQLAIVLYTSGSTGVPKGVRLPHEVILNRLQWQWNTFPYTATETVGVFKTALTFVDSISELWGPLLSGLTILVVPKPVIKDPERLVNVLEEYKIRRLVLVPTLLRSLLLYLNLGVNANQKQKQSQRMLQHLHIWVCSGEPLSTTLANNFFDYFEEGVHKLFNFYGSTEVMGDVTYFACESKKQMSAYDRVPIGVPVSNTVIYLLDTDYRPVKNGEIGEIFVAGLNLANGYVNGRDADRFLENPLAVEYKYSRIYRTGDYGSAQSGQIIYEGRTDSQIKIRGHRVDLSEVEKQVSDLAVVDKAIVLCYHAGQVDQALLAFVKLRDDAPLLTEIQIEAKLKSKLADYMTPQVVIIDRVPLLVNGKVDRQSLLKSYETTNNNEGDSSIVLDYDYSQVPVEMKAAARDLFETVGGVIGRSTRATLTPQSNFYELGGNSLNSIFTVTLLREKGYFIGISEFIAAKTLGEILEKMTKNREVSPTADEDMISACPHLDMESVPLNHSHKNDVIDIIVDSFYGKADLEQWLKPDILRSDYKDIINDIWEALIDRDLSFVVRDRNTNKIIGTSLNFDARDEPEIEVKSKLIIVFEFLEFLEGPIRDNYLPKGINKILHSFMMGTNAELNPKENIAVMNFMENQVLRVAKEKHFAGIMTTNTNPLTQQLGNNVYHYKALVDYQVNEYVYSDGSRPFGQAPDSQRAIVHWKEVTH